MRKCTPESRRRFVKSGILCTTGLSFAPASALYTRGKEEELWKWSREGLFYVSTPQGVRCVLCPNECNLHEGEAGDCRNRVNYKGRLFSIAYGNPCAVHTDPVEKKPLYHFLPGTRTFSIATAGCNLACLNCQNWSISQASPKETRNYDLMPQAVVDEAVKRKCNSISYTYSEPITFFEYTCDTARLARERNIRNIIVSAGYIHEKPLRHMAQWTDAANIDLKSFSDDLYMRLCGGSLEPVLRTLQILKEMDVWLEITNLLVPSWTDDLSMIRRMCKWLFNNGFADTPLHFSRFHPQYKLTQLPPTPAHILEKAFKVATEEGLKHVYVGNVPSMGHENTVCGKCREILVERRGYTILQNNIQNGNCRFCKTNVPGIWE